MPEPGVTAFCEIRLALFHLLQRAYAAPATADLAADLSEAFRLYGALTDIELPTCEAPTGNAEAEFNRLFVGPGRLPAPPYESVWRSEDRLLMQGATEEIRAIYREYGVQNTRPEPEDHLALELEFYALLQHRVIDGEEPNRHLTAQQRFLTEHLAAWLPAFTRAIETHTTSPFYRSLAEATRHILGAEPAVLSSLQSAISAKEESVHA